ncbi:hypothetical protein [Dokdonella sp.]|uniref:RCC1 domain-containing protein n=1 Tax=Dokdonella sp. TaxID=2291710 RepID=UPI0026371A0A|nr:hypothetical protein [Dokdonella sp.]
MIRQRRLLLLFLLPLGAPLAALHARTSSMSDPIASRIAANFVHTCALTVTGAVKCWGGNFSGQLGDGTTETRPAPVEVGLNAPAAAIATGMTHSCALSMTGAVQCWGDNSNGQLGDGTTTNRLAPVDVANLGSGVAAISVGAGHTCALTDRGGVKCWGANASGQLGDGSVAPRPVPADVVGLSANVVAVAGNGDHACALTFAGDVKCWGNNGAGQLGDGTIVNRSAPVDVAGLGTPVAAVVMGLVHTCALTVAGGVKCWGENGDGQLGDGSTVARPVPTDVVGLASGVAAIAAGVNHTCAVMASGDVKCWGYNYSGQLGDGTTVSSPIPLQVPRLEPGTAAIATGFMHTCALSVHGDIQCWGDNSLGQLGSGTPSDPTSAPSEVHGFATGFASFDAGFDHTCALSRSGTTQCWGDNQLGQLGVGAVSAEANPTPREVLGLADTAIALAVGGYHTCATFASGAAQCWGYNGDGELGDGSTASRTLPVDVSALDEGAALLSAGGQHTCAITPSGAAKCWGWNAYGQVGDDSLVNRPEPVAVAGLDGDVASIAAFDSHTCALIAEGGVKCWGYNYSGQLGDGSYADRRVPVDVDGLPAGATSVVTGVEHSCALMLDATVKCWGLNDHGELGNGAIVHSSAVPVAVDGLLGVQALTSGAHHACVLTAPGRVKCWGLNNHGQLGDGSTVDSAAAVDVAGLDDVVAIGAGYFHTCALTATGDLKCWGANERGALGNGATADRHVPASLLLGQSLAFQVAATMEAGESLPLTATATGGGSASFDVWTPATCTIEGTTLRAIRSGLCGVRASQTGSADAQGNGHAPAPQQLRLVRIARGTQTIRDFLATPAHPTYAPNATFQVSAQAGASGSPVVFSIAPTSAAICAIAGRSVTILAAGTCTVLADQAGGGEYEPAPQVRLDVVIAKAEQRIAFAPAPTVLVGGSGAVSARSGVPNSGNPIVFSATPATVCMIDGATVSGVGAGVCTVTASQAGDGNYLDGEATLALRVIRPGQALLDVGISDDRDYARYGMELTYVVTVSNGGQGDAIDLRVAAALPPQLDPARTQWTCLDGGDGASCTASGSGALEDTGVVVPAGRSLRWRITTAVRADAGGEAIEHTVAVVQDGVSLEATDRDVLVLFRSGFDAAPTDGAERGQP